MNQIVQVKTSTKEYEVIIGGGLHYGEEIAKVKKPCKVVVVSDDIVFSLYGEKHADTKYCLSYFPMVRNLRI